MGRAGAFGVLLFALTGCGTVENFKRKAPDDAPIYGGTEIAVDRLTPHSQNEGFGLAIFWPVYVADVVASAAGDTLTLPITIPNAIVHAVNEGIRDYYFPKDKPSEGQIERREFRFDETAPRPEPTPPAPLPKGKGE